MTEPLMPKNQHDLLEYLSSQIWGDVSAADVVVSAFGEEYRLHSLLLNRSPFFRSMFADADWAESRARRVTLEIDDPYITSQSLRECLFSFYGGAVQLTDETHALGVFATASYLALHSLQEECQKVLLSHLNIDLVVKYYNFFSNRCIEGGEVILQAVRSIIYTRAPKKPEVLLELPLPFVEQILSSDALCVSGEIERLELLELLVNGFEQKIAETQNSSRICESIVQGLVDRAITSASSLATRPSSAGQSVGCKSPVSDRSSSPACLPLEYFDDSRHDAEGLTASAVERFKLGVLSKLHLSTLTPQQLFALRARNFVPAPILHAALWRKEYARTTITGLLEPMATEEVEGVRRCLSFPAQKLLSSGAGFGTTSSVCVETFFAFGSLWKATVRMTGKDGAMQLSCFVGREGASLFSKPEYVDPQLTRKCSVSIGVPAATMAMQQPFRSFVYEFKAGDSRGYHTFCDLKSPQEILTDQSLLLIVSVCPA